MDKKKEIKPIDPDVPGLPGVPDLPGVPNRRLNIPRHAEGGMVDSKDSAHSDDFTTGIKDGVNHDLDSLKAMFKSAHDKYASSQNDYGNLKGLQDMANKKAKGYDDGGVVSDVDPNELPSGAQGDDWKDKLAAVMKAMGMGAQGAVSSVLPGTQSLTNAIAPAAASAAQAPGVSDSVNAALGTHVQGLPAPMPVPPPQQAPSMSTNPVPTPPVPAQALPAQNPQSVPPTPPSGNEAHPANDILQKLTDGDGAKMQALLASLKDQDKRSQFAQALGVIGDTFGNIGRARAGMPGEGFKTAKMFSDMNKDSKQSQIENLTQSLAADPNSQTSRMAQASLMQSMGIKPGDPREAKIRAMPALSITHLLPQMTDAVKNNIEREKNAIESKRADTAGSLEKDRLTMEKTNADRQASTAQTTAANDTLKNTHFWNTDARDAALNTLQKNAGGPSHGVPDLGSTFNGHKVVKVTRVK